MSNPTGDALKSAGWKGQAMSSEMVERMARAQWESDRPASRPPWDEADLEHRAAALELARIAIAAMREPTRAMVEAAESIELYDGLDTDTGNPSPEAAWQAMIDAALT